MSTDTIALFLTWTVYGTFLPGDCRGWRHRTKGHMPRRQALERWHHDRLQHPVITLNANMRFTVEEAVEEISTFRSWRLLAVSARSNHVHVVLESSNYSPFLVRDQLKAKSTFELRRRFDIWRSRPVWSAKGDIEFLDNEQDIERCILYVAEAQDRMD